MNTRIITFALLLFMSHLSFAQKKIGVKEKWVTEPVLKTPESVLYDKERSLLYVANINGKAGEKDGNGFISKLSVNGKVEVLEWVGGLNAPKGMGIYKGILYVTDISSGRIFFKI